MARKEYKRDVGRPDEGRNGCLFGGYFFALLFSMVFVSIGLATNSNVLLIVPWVLLLIFLLFVAVSWTYTRFSLFLAWLRWGRKGRNAIIVLSDSPNHRGYIDEHWLLPLTNKFILIDVSSAAKDPLAMKIVKRFYRGDIDGGSPREAKPAVVVLRGVKRPKLYKFYYAFRNAKHGDLYGLKCLEKQLFIDLGVSYPEKD